MKPAVSCSPNSNITLPFKDYIRAIIPKCDEIAKKSANEVLVATHRQTALPLNCHDPWKKQGEKERSYSNSETSLSVVNCPQMWTIGFIATYFEHSQQEKFYHLINASKLLN